MSDNLTHDSSERKVTLMGQGLRWWVPYWSYHFARHPLLTVPVFWRWLWGLRTVAQRFERRAPRTGVDSHTPPRPQPRKEDANP